MDFEWVLPTVASLLGSTGIGFIVWLSQQKLLRDAKDRDACADAKQQEARYQLKILRSVGKLTYANSIAIQEGKVNGVMAKAIADYEEVSKEFDDFLEEQSIIRPH